MSPKTSSTTSRDRYISLISPSPGHRCSTTQGHLENAEQRRGQTRVHSRARNAAPAYQGDNLRDIANSGRITGRMPTGQSTERTTPVKTGRQSDVFSVGRCPHRTGAGDAGPSAGRQAPRRQGGRAQLPILDITHQRLPLPAQVRPPGYHPGQHPIHQAPRRPRLRRRRRRTRLLHPFTQRPERAAGLGAHTLKRDTADAIEQVCESRGTRGRSTSASRAREASLGAPHRSKTTRPNVPGKRGRDGADRPHRLAESDVHCTVTAWQTRGATSSGVRHGIGHDLRNG